MTAWTNDATDLGGYVPTPGKAQTAKTTRKPVNLAATDATPTKTNETTYIIPGKRDRVEHRTEARISAGRFPVATSVPRTRVQLGWMPRTSQHEVTKSNTETADVTVTRMTETERRQRLAASAKNAATRNATRMAESVTTKKQVLNAEANAWLESHGLDPFTGNTATEKRRKRSR